MKFQHSVVAAVITFSVATAAPAAARQIDHYTTVDEQSIVVDWCGADMPFRDDYRVEMKILDRATGPNQMPRHAQLNKGVAVWTNLHTGKSDHDRLATEHPGQPCTNQ